MMPERLSSEEENLFMKMLEEQRESGAMLFGRFLALRGLISNEDIFNARMFQKSQNRRIGEVAVERGIMDEEDVERLLIYQEETGIRFGDLAMHLGFLSSEQLDELLVYMESSYIYFGESLVSLGIIEESVMMDNLRIFQRFRINEEGYNA